MGEGRREGGGKGKEGGVAWNPEAGPNQKLSECKRAWSWRVSSVFSGFGVERVALDTPRP